MKRPRSESPDLQPNNGKEIERKFLIKNFDRRVLDTAEFVHEIVQGFLITKDGLQVRTRILDDLDGMANQKGKGKLERDEAEEVISVNAAKMYLNCCKYIVKKTRYRLPHAPDAKIKWLIDVIYEPFALIVGECELDTKDTPVVVPPEIYECTDVTDSISNFTLALIGSYLTDVSEEEFTKILSQKIPIIALTGAPGAGKSETIKNLLKEPFKKDIMFMPEVATLLIAHARYSAPTSSSDPMINIFQRTVYEIQKALEFAFMIKAAHKGKRLVIADRGSRDGEVYCPNGTEQFNKLCHTDQENENNRYDAVYYLELPSEEVYNRIKSNNPARQENYELAKQLAIKTREAWNGHKNFHIIPDAHDWDTKYKKIREHVLSHMKKP